MPKLTIKAKDFATELTSHNVTDKDLKGEQQISKEHIDNDLAVRKMLKERGVLPEQLSAAEDVKSTTKTSYRRKENSQANKKDSKRKKEEDPGNS